MASLQPGMLVKMLEHINDSSTKVAGEHRSVLLQVIGIMPALAGQELWPRLGFHIRVADGSHCMYVSVSPKDGDIELVLNGKLQLGQFLYAERLDIGSPFPRLVGIKPVATTKQPCSVNPEELASKLEQIPQEAVLQALVADHNVKKAPLRREKLCNSDGVLCKWEIPRLPPPVALSERTKISSRETVQGVLAVPSRDSKNLITPSVGEENLRQLSIASRKDSRKVLPDPPKRLSSENRVQLESGVASRRDSKKMLPESPKLFDGQRSVRNPSARPALKVRSQSNTVVNQENTISRNKAFLFEKTPVKTHPGGGSNDGRNVLLTSKELHESILNHSRRTATKRLEARDSVRHSVSSLRERRESSELSKRGPRVSASRSSISVAGRTSGIKGVARIDSTRTVSRKSWDLVSMSIACKTVDHSALKSSAALKTTNQTTLVSSKKNIDSSRNLKESNSSNECTAQVKPSECPALVVPKHLVIHDGRLTDGSISWDSISPTLADCAKEVTDFKISVSLAAAQALQEASAAEVVLRNVSVFAEICSESRPELPRESMEKYFDFNDSLQRAINVADALAKNYQSGLQSDCKKFDDGRVSSEKQKNSISWISAALSTDLAYLASANELNIKSIVAEKRTSTKTNDSIESVKQSQRTSTKGSSRSPSPGRSVLRHPSPSSARGKTSATVSSKTTIKKQREEQSPIQTKDSNESIVNNALHCRVDALELVAKLARDLHCSMSIKDDWVWAQKATKIRKVCDLARQLRNESQQWFFKYMEDAMNCGFQFKRICMPKTPNPSKVPKENEPLAGAFPHLKQLNDWIGQLDQETLDSKMLEILDRLKKKICEFLLQHMKGSVSR